MTACRDAGLARSLPLLDRGDAPAALAAIGGNSPFLADLATRDCAAFLALLTRGPDAVAAEACAALDGIGRHASRQALHAALRRAKRVVALATAYADLGGFWSLDAVTGALTRLADTALREAVDHLLARAGLAGRDPARPSQGSGFAVLAMGKLGAGELNYSSDIDLILLYDPEGPGSVDRGGRSARFARLAHELVALMQTRDADGYVFRTDLRLRPDPRSTPPAISIPAAIGYYESLAATWERAALSKARPVAGDLDCGEAILRTLSPFVWRRHLDFAAIDDMRAMKDRIDRAAGDRADHGRFLGRDLKRGRGGIREIEFIAQTLQLVWGGRDPAFRQRGTLQALASLADASHLDRVTAARLARSYALLRRLEHRLQMVADRQTHALPADAVSFDRFAVFAGFEDAQDLRAALHDATAPVETAFRAILADGDPPADHPDAALDARFARPDDARALLAAWRAGRPRALRHPRARALHEQLLATLLPALAAGRHPDAALARWAALVERLPEGVPMLSLLARNRPLVRRIADLLDAAPALADALAASPGALEGLLATEAIDPDPGRTLRRLVGGRRDAELLDVAIETARRFVRAEQFRLGADELDARIDVDVAGRARTDLADAVITFLLGRVRRAHEARHGRIAGGGLVVVGLGKAGSRRMMAGSDLDLLLIYDHAPGATESTGAAGTRPLAPGPYYGRLAQRLIAALTTPGSDGPLFACDMRLRPSGRAGPVAVSLSAFARYHAGESWTWERMALTRARPVAGPAPLRARVAEAIAAALDRDDGAMRAAAAAMRARLARDRPPEGPFDAKLRPGGLMDVEFIAQVLQLGPRPGLRRATDTARALRALADAGVIGRRDARALVAADRFWRVMQSRLRLLDGLRPPPPPLPPALADNLACAIGKDPAAEADRVAATVGEAFGRLVGR